MKITHIAWLGRRNYGDDIMSEAIRQYFRSSEPNADFTIWSEEKPLTSIEEARWIYPSEFARKMFGRFFEHRALRKTNLFIIGGGSMLHSWRSISWKLAGLQYLKKHNPKAKAVGIGISIGPFDNKESEKLCVNFLTLLDACSFRDKDSFDFACSLPLPYKPILAFDLAGAYLSQKKIEPKSETEKTNFVGLAARLPHNETRSKAVLLYASLIKKIKDAGYLPKLFVFSETEDAVEKTFLEELEKKSGLSKEDQIVYGDDLESFTEEIKKCDLFISSRFHGCVLPFLLNIPFVSIAHGGPSDHKKFRDFSDYIMLPLANRFTESQIGEIDVRKIIKHNEPQHASGKKYYRDLALKNFEVFGVLSKKNGEVKHIARGKLSKERINNFIKRKILDFSCRSIGDKLNLTDQSVLHEVVGWIERAEDSTGGKGVARGYSLIDSPKFGKSGWQPAYPETTGYLIPTLLAASKIFDDKDLKNRARRMADWELEIMDKNGSIPGGTISKGMPRPKSAMFDTGQVIRGLLAIFSETQAGKYLDASRKAALWILNNETDRTGQWTEANASSVNSKTTVYNIFAVPPLVELGIKDNDTELKELGRRVADYTISMQAENGWLRNCDFDYGDDALLHTIAYAIDGLWDIGVLLESEKYRKGATKALDGVMSSMGIDGFLSGRLDKNWNGTVGWACLTGSAQIGITALKIFERTGEPKYFDCAMRLKEYLKKHINTSDNELAGGKGAVFGSFPIGGGYQSYQAINWGAKFFADLLIKSIELKNKDTKTASSTGQKTINALCMSFWTPPIVRPQSILIGKMIPEWIRQGIETVVLGYDSCGKWDINAPVYQIPEYVMPKKLERIPIARNLAEYLYYRKLMKFTVAIVKKHGIDVIFSFSNPQASNILGAMVKKRTGIPFVALFSDPWYDNPYKSFSRLGAVKVRVLERFIVKWADRVIFITEKTKKLVMKKYPRAYEKKALVVPHCYDPKDYPDAKKTGNKFVISYIGAFYKDRNPGMLMQAVSALLDKKPELRQKITLMLVGSANEYAGFTKEIVAEMINRYKLKDVVNLVPTVSYKESLRYMKESDCLVVIDADFVPSPFLPSKTVDYAGSGQPIVGITPKESGTRDFLTKLGYPAFNYNELPELTKCIESMIIGRTSALPDKTFLQEHSVQSTTKKLLNEFKDVLKH